MAHKQTISDIKFFLIDLIDFHFKLKVNNLPFQNGTGGYNTLDTLRLNELFQYNENLFAKIWYFVKFFFSTRYRTIIPNESSFFRFWFVSDLYACMRYLWYRLKNQIVLLWYRNGIWKSIMNRPNKKKYPKQAMVYLYIKLWMDNIEVRMVSYKYGIEVEILSTTVILSKK